MIKTEIPQIDEFVKAELELIGGEENEDEQAQLWRIFNNGMRAILSAQLQLPAYDDERADGRVQRRIQIIKGFLEKCSDKSSR